MHRLRNRSTLIQVLLVAALTGAFAAAGAYLAWQAWTDAPTPPETGSVDVPAPETTPDPPDPQPSPDLRSEPEPEPAPEATPTPPPAPPSSSGGLDITARAIASGGRTSGTIHIEVSARARQAGTTNTRPLHIAAVVDDGLTATVSRDVVEAALAETLDTLRPGDTFSVVSFGETAEVVLAPSTLTSFNRDSIAAEIAFPNVAGGDCLHCGLDAAATQLERAATTGHRAVLVLSGAEGHVGAATLSANDAVRRLVSANVRMEAVDLRGSTSAPLARLARMTGGSLAAVSPVAADLEQRTEAAASALRSWAERRVAAGVALRLELAPGVRHVSNDDPRIVVADADTLTIDLGDVSLAESHRIAVDIEASDADAPAAATGGRWHGSGALAAAPAAVLPRSLGTVFAEATDLSGTTHSGRAPLDAGRIHAVDLN